MRISLLEGLALRARGIPRTPKELEQSLRLLGVLRGVGFQTSMRQQLSLDATGESIPWWTFAANEWIKARIRPTDRVFEYGCGSSTIWLAARVKSVTSVEHDPVWVEKIQPRLPANASVVHRPASDEFADDVTSPYCAAIGAHGPPFDIIIVDGMERNACARLAPQMLAADGIVIFDNSDRTPYHPGMTALAEAGLWRIDMAGCVRDLGMTSIFGRTMGRWLDATAMPPDLSLWARQAS